MGLTAKVRTNGSGESYIEWGWLAKAAALVVLAGIPSGLAAGAAMYIRVEQRLTVLEQQQQWCAAVEERQQRWIEDHEKWAQGERDRIREAIEQVRRERTRR